MAHGPDLTPGGAGNVHRAGQRGVEGFYRAARQLNGQWGLLDPAGRPVYIRAAHAVCNEAADTVPAPSGDAAVRLRTWGFNAVGLGGDGAGRDDGFAFFQSVDFGPATGLITLPGIRVPDVFAPDWPTRAAAHAARVCAPVATVRELIGWVTDDLLAWGMAAPNRPGLLQACLSLEPSFAAYHAAWEFLLALHGGKLDAVARAWAVSLPNKEVVRELTRSDTAISTRGYARDETRWLREFAGRYFRTTAAAIRAADPNHLVCGCRFATSPSAAVMAAAAYPDVDLTWMRWTELPPPGTVAGPLVADDVGWAGDEFWTVPLNPDGTRRPQRLTSVERMLRRARTALRRMARHPAVVGYVWGRWRDDPGEQPPFARGLVHVRGTEARENTELIADFNARAEALRRTAAKQLSP